MGAARKYPDELRDRAVRLVLDLGDDRDTCETGNGLILGLSSVA